MEGKIQELQKRIDKQMIDNDEKDLEISRLRRESEETNSKNKSHNQKIVEYQATNERLRKDKGALEEKFEELKK